MMKKYFKIASLLVLTGIVFLSCEEQRIEFEGPDYVRFTDTTLVFKESHSLMVPVRVHLVGKPRTEPITVSYSVSGTAIEGRDYTIEGPDRTVTIPANSFFGTIPVNFINNSNNILRTQEIIFSLRAVSGGDDNAAIQTGTGKNNLLGSSLRLTIQDDCLFGGFYTGKRAGYTGQVKDVEITSTNCTDYLLSNWNIGILSFNADRLTLQFTDNGDNSITIPSQFNGFLGDTLMGNGAWDPRTRDIVLNVMIKTETEAGKDTLITIPQLTYTVR